MNHYDYNEEVDTLKYIAVQNSFNSSLTGMLVTKHLNKTPSNTSRYKTEYGSSLSHTFKNLMDKNSISVSFKTVKLDLC